jgi:long-subunit acyl-CoA synthetase (AMP-forming)
VIVGGAACPLSVMEDFDRYGVETRVGWGMTEMSPLGSVNESTAARESTARRVCQAAPQGRAPDLRRRDEDRRRRGQGTALGRRGLRLLKVRGPWICSDYYKLEGGSSAHAEEGWFETGDVATIDPRATWRSRTAPRT